MKSKSEKLGKGIENTEKNDNVVQPERVEASKTKTRDLITSKATGQHQTSRKSESKKELKRKRSSNKTSKSNFSKFLDMETDRMMASAEEDMLLERKLAKKLKVKSGRLTNANDDLDMLLEGIPTMADNLGKIAKDDKKAAAFSSKSKRMDSVNEDSDDEASYGEGSEDSDSLTSDDEHEDVEAILPNDPNISSDEGSEESDLLTSDEEHEDVVEVISTKDSGTSEQEADPRIISNTEAGPPKTDKSSNKEPGKYVAPHLRSRGGDGSAEYAEERKRLRGMSSPYVFSDGLLPLLVVVCYLLD